MPIGRFAPSPSGRMHLGNVFSALLAWLSAKRAGGDILLRIEDLDPARSRREYAETIMDDFRWLGLHWDGRMEDQSSRGDAYESALETLTRKGLIYPCYCTRDQLHAASAPHASDGRVIYAGACRDLTEAQRKAQTKAPSLRLRVPAETIAFRDGLQGTFSMDLAKEWGDFIVRRADGVAAYQLAVVVDDGAMGVTQVVRGSDLLDSTPRQLWLQERLGLPHPEYGHVPLLLAPDGRRLAKRDRDQELGALQSCYSAQELVGQLALLAGLIPEYAPISPAELIPLFSWEKLPQADCAVHWADGICTFFTKTIQSPVQRDLPPV